MSLARVGSRWREQAPQVQLHPVSSPAERLHAFSLTPFLKFQGRTVLGTSDVVVFAVGAGPGSGPKRKRPLDQDGAVKAARNSTFELIAGSTPIPEAIAAL